MVTLRVLVGPEFDEEISVRTPTFSIGRAGDCDLRPHCPLVSRHHCELILDGTHLAIRDNHSKNGTFVNGQRVLDQQELHSGDVIGVGLRRLTVEIHADLSPSTFPDAPEELAECLPWTPA